jgi:hypothetical protein
MVEKTACTGLPKQGESTSFESSRVLSDPLAVLSDPTATSYAWSGLISP